MNPAGAIRIATRASDLARWQADHVGARLAADGRSYELVVVETSGDRRAEVAIRDLGGKGAFVKEVQAAVLDGRADVAVHSAKDLPSRPVPGLVLACVPERADPHDVLVGSRLSGLAPGATVATGSRRRAVQLAALRPDLSFVELRGNIATRLTKVPAGGAVVVAAAALQRLGLEPEVAERLGTDQMVPQVGQGALAVECRDDDEALVALVAGVEHRPSRRAVDAERAFLTELGGDCDLPAGAHATEVGGADGELVLEAVLGAEAELVPGQAPVLVRTVQRGMAPEALGRATARELRARLG